MKTNRRSFLRMTGALGATALVLHDNSIELVAQASRALGSRQTAAGFPANGRSANASTCVNGRSVAMRLPGREARADGNKERVAEK